MGQSFRRVVTGHDENGTAIIAMDGIAQNVRVREANGITPPDGGSVFRIVEFTPDNDAVSNEEMKKELGLDPDDGTVVRHPGMHRTRSVDYAIVLKGEIDMLVDDDEVHVKEGDVIVQRGTNHAWANRGTENCIIAFVLIDAKEL